MAKPCRVGDLAELRLGLEGVKANFCATHPAKAQCDGLLDKLITGVDQSRTNLGAASVGLGDVSAGLSNAIATLSIPAAGCDPANPTLLCGATAVTDGAGKAKDGRSSSRVASRRAPARAGSARPAASRRPWPA